MGFFGNLFGSTSTQLTVHNTGTNGTKIYKVEIGKDLSEAEWRELSLRAINGNVYIIHAYKSGEYYEKYISKEQWINARNLMDSI